VTSDRKPEYSLEGDYTIRGQAERLKNDLGGVTPHQITLGSRRKSKTSEPMSFETASRISPKLVV